MTEIWRDIGGYEGLYQVSNLGRVKSSYRGGRILKPISNDTGYLYVNLYRGGKLKGAFVHRLVATAFIPNSDNKPQVNHINGDKSDNRVENLEWVTSSENQQHAYDTGLRGSNGDNPLAKLTNTQVVYIRDNPDSLSIKQLAHMFGVTPTTISYIQRGKIYKAAGGVIHKSKRPRVPDEVRKQIRREYKPNVRGYGCPALAKKFGVSTYVIWRAVHEGNN